MSKKYINIQNLSVSEDFYNFINKKAIPGTDITEDTFWSGLSKVSHELAPKNKELLMIRKELQMKLDRWHLENYEKEFNVKEYKSYLEKIGYLKKEGMLIIAGSLNRLKRNGSTLSRLSGPPKLKRITAFFIFCF